MSEPLYTVDLTNCDREQIHVLGNIQPFGFLLTMSADWLINRASENLEIFTGLTAQGVLGQPLTAIFLERAVHSIRNRLTMLRGPDAVERLFGVTLIEGRPPFDLALHFAGDAIVIEAEPASEAEMEAAALVRAMIARLGQSEGLNAFFREGARQVRALTGFDRVMVYRFDEQGSGEVVAEALRPGVDSFLGLHYPASDIPAQARKLYLRNIFRVIKDVNARPVAIVPQQDPRGHVLDQSLCVLRAVSPIHIEYLKNMGVAASLSISIIVGGKLWGLFACHHYEPRLPGFAARTAAELFGQMFSFMLESRERREAADYETRARVITDRLMAAVAQDGDLLSNAPWLGDIIADTIPADGVGVYLDGAISLNGLTPTREEFEPIVAMLNQVAASQIFATDCLGELLPAAAAYADRTAGLVAIPLSRSPRDYVVLFRSEQMRSVRWAGNPEKPVEYGPMGARLTPRKSFEAWSELVKGRSLPFTSAELRVAEALRVGMLEVLVRLADSAGRERLRAHERQEVLIAELNHRVRNILALIRGLISQTRSNAETVEGFVATLDDRIQALARAHDQLTADRWGPARLSDLVQTEAGAYLASKRDRVNVSGPNILVQPSAFAALALVFHELMTNAAKYGALSDSGTVAVDWRLDDDGSLLIDWREQGGPVVVAPTRRGFGSTIIEQSIPYDLGGRTDIFYRASGFEAQFCVPSRHIAGVAEANADAAQPGDRPQVENPLKGRTVLLVEDSMIIALDAEDAMRELGARQVVTAASVARAMGALDAGTFDFALLDVNLGGETSAAIADRLAAARVLFAFATGYGESAMAGHPDVPVIAKPYGVPDLRRLLTRIRF